MSCISRLVNAIGMAPRPIRQWGTSRLHSSAANPLTDGSWQGRRSCRWRRLLKNQLQKVPAEYEAGCESNDHQWDVIELAGTVGAAVEAYRNGEGQYANRERDARLGQAHARIKGRTAVLGSNGLNELLDRLD